MNNLFLGSSFSSHISPLWMNIMILFACFALVVMLIVSINLVLKYATELVVEIIFVIPALISAKLTLLFIITIKAMKSIVVNAYSKVKNINKNALERRRMIQNNANKDASKKKQEQRSATRNQPIKSRPMCSKPGQNATIANSTNTVEKTDGIDYSIPAYKRAGIDINKGIDTANEATENSTSVYLKTGNDTPASKKEVFSRREKRKALLNEKSSGKSQRIQQLYSRDFSTPSAI